MDSSLWLETVMEPGSGGERQVWRDNAGISLCCSPAPFSSIHADPCSPVRYVSLDMCNVQPGIDQQPICAPCHAACLAVGTCDSALSISLV